MKRSRVLGFLCLAIGVLAGVPARGDGLIRDGLGPISTGRGGTNQAFADNAVIILDNPGGLVNVEGDGLAEVGADTVITQVQYSNPLSGVVSHVRPLPMPVLGCIKKSDNGCWAFGIGAFVPAGFGAAYGAMISPIVGPTEYRSIGGMGKILPALSYKATDRLSVGISVGLAFSDIQIYGPYVLQNAPLTGLPAVMNMSGFGVAPTGSIGLQYQVNERTMIGASYTEEVNMTLRGGANASLIAPNPFPPPPFLAIPSHFDTKLHMKWPRSVAFGIKHELCAHRRVSADVIWYDWGGAFDQIDIQLSNPTNPIVGGLVPLPVNDTLPLNWTNSVSMRLGYEWLPNDLDTWRCGYVYHGSPVPDSTLNPYLDGILVHAFSLGYSRKFDRIIFNSGYQYSFGPTRNVTDSAIVGGDFDDTRMRAQAHFATLSLLVPF
jgi:long-subunit fatty acid transport protein